MTTGIAKPADLFKMGLNYLRTKDLNKAQQAFAHATAAEPGMCDAWVGRLAAGDPDFAEIAAGAYKSRGNLGSALRSAKDKTATIYELEAQVKLTLGAIGLTWQVSGDTDLAIAYAISLAESSDPNLAAASEVIERAARRNGLSAFEMDMLDYARLGLLGMAARWPDVLNITSEQVWRSEIPALTGLLDAGMHIWKVWALIGTGNPSAAQQAAESGLSLKRMPSDVYQKLQLARGYALRALGQRDEAMQAFRDLRAWMPSTEVSEAIAHPDKTIDIVTAESLATRRDVWDPTSGESAAALETAELDSEREKALDEAMEELGQQIGMDGVKEQIRRLRARIAMDKLRADRGLGDRKDVGLAFIFAGPPGTGKTTMARIVAKVFFGLGLISRFDVVEVSRQHLVGKYLGATAQKTDQVITSALGGLLFIDEAYSLIQKGYSEGDSFGQEAVDTLLARMENERTSADPRKKLVVVIAGYADDIDRLLDSNDGFRGRFTTRIEFVSYTPSDLVEIATKMAKSYNAAYSAEAQELLEQHLEKLSTIMVFDEKKNREIPGLDKAGNARFVRHVTEQAAEFRDCRVFERDPTTLSDEDLYNLNADDVDQAYRVVAVTQGVDLS